MGKKGGHFGSLLLIITELVTYNIESWTRELNAWRDLCDEPAREICSDPDIAKCVTFGSNCTKQSKFDELKSEALGVFVGTIMACCKNVKEIRVGGPYCMEYIPHGVPVPLTY